MYANGTSIQNIGQDICLVEQYFEKNNLSINPDAMQAGRRIKNPKEM
jgi:hypothetical protein